MEQRQTGGGTRPDYAQNLAGLKDCKDARAKKTQPFMKGVELMFISFAVSYLVLSIITFIIGVVYQAVSWNNFAKSQAISFMEYLKFLDKYLDTLSDVKWYEVIARVLLISVWYIPHLIRFNKEAEIAYMNSNK